ncbi:metalloprotease [Candidozyma auris]
MLRRLFANSWSPFKIPSLNLFSKHKISAMRSTYTILADDSAIEKPLLDDRSYRFIKLDSNDLHVLLISDPTTDRSAASLDVHVGSFADKEYTIPGLAHFCEHLLFMGTGKYPEENEYSSYLSKHSGHSNAYTAAEHTNYFFEVSSDYLEGALDRFAQFFIDPLFSKSCKDREIRAVDSENKKNLQNDMWRFYQLDKSTSNPKHPYNGFSTGNYHTLHEEPESRGLNVRDVLLEFYKEHYSSNLMSLVVLGKDSLDDLTLWAITKFSDVANSNLPRPSYHGELIYAPENMGKLLKAKPIMDTNKLELTFMIPDDQEHNWDKRPGSYYSHLIGHESKGSILYYLQKKNWVNELSAGNMKVCDGCSLFSMELDLTPSGFDHWEEIVVHVFEYLKMLQSQDPPYWLWKELSDMSKINFRFKQKERTSNTVSKLSSSLFKFKEDFYIPPERLLNCTVLREFDPEEIKKYGAHLNPSSLRISLSSQRLNNLPNKERWYGTEYSYEEIPPNLMNAIRNASVNEELHLPAPNKFIPEDFTVKGEKLEKALPHPWLITDTPKFEIWYKQDDRFRIPKGSISLVVHTPPLADSIETSVLGLLLGELMDDEFNEMNYFADLVGLSFHLSQFRDSFTIKASGYNDKLPAFLDEVLRKFINFTPKSDRFDSIKYKVAQELKNSGYDVPYAQIGTHFLQLLNEKTYPDPEKLKVLEKVKFEDVLQFTEEKLWSRGVFIQGLIHGNFEYSTAAKVSQSLQDAFKDRQTIAPTKEEVDSIVKFQSVHLEVGENVRYELPLQDPSNVNSCLEYFVQVGKVQKENSRLRVLTDLLATMLHEPCFNQLRTKEQLGYVVFSGYRSSRSYFGLRILVQSERPCDYLQYRVENFLKMFKRKKLGSSLTDEVFAKYKQSLRNMKLAKLKNLGEETSLYWNAINNGFYDFEQKANDVQILESVTPQELVQFFNDYFDVDEATKSARLTVCLNSRKKSVFDEKKNFITAVHNYIYEHNIPISTEAVDKIVEQKGLDFNAVANIIFNADMKENLDQHAFITEMEQRTKSPTPALYPKGKLEENTYNFKEAHPRGGVPKPVNPLSKYYYPHEEAHL